MNTRLRTIQAACATALALLAGPGHALDLVDSFDKAQAFDPRMRAAEQAVLAGREKTVQGDALLKPQVALSASLMQVQSGSSVSQGGTGRSGSSDGGGAVHQMALQLAKPLYNAKATADRAQMYQQAALADVSHLEARQDLVQRVAQAYFNVLLAQDSLRVAQAEQAAVQLQRDRAQARFEAGRSRITDVQETQARLDGATARAVSASGTLALRQAQYQELTGVPALGLAPLRDDFRPQAPQPDNLSAWQAKGLDHNTAVQKRRGELAIASAEIGKYTLRGRPTLDLVASYTYKGQNGGLVPTIAPDSRSAAMVGLQFNMPLYTGGALDSRQRESVARQHQSEQELEAAQRDARLQVQDAWQAVQTGIARTGALEQSVRSAQTALEATTLGRDVGNRIDLDVLDAQQRLYTNQLDLAQARNDYLMARVRLASAAGELQEDALRGLNAYLAP